MHTIGIHSVPRSGSNWLGSIFDSSPAVIYKHQPLFSYKFKGFLSEYSSSSDIDKYFLQVANCEDEFIDRKEAKRNKLVMEFKKNDLANIETLVYKENRYHYVLNNLLKKNNTVLIIGLIRNPLSVISSWFRAPREFHQDWKIEEEWRFALKKNLNRPEEYFGFEKWKEVMYLFEFLKKQYPTRFYLLNYNDLLQDRINTVQDIFSFCQLDFSQQTYNYLNDLPLQENKDAYSVFKGKKHDNKWQNHLPDYIIESIKSDSGFIDFNSKYQWV